MPVPPSTVPTSTYRLQITDDFTLSDAADRVGYLAELGVGAVYVSPLLASVDGSTHGYDVVDHTRVDEARGGTAGLAELAEACRWHGLGLVVDIVPNHMGVEDASQNHAWWEVLRLGRDAPTAHWFDIDWQINDGRVLIPVLGDAFDARRDLTVVSCTTTSTGTRSRPVPDQRPARPQPRSTTGSTTSWSATGGPIPTRTTAASSRSPRWPACASRTPMSSTPPTPRSCAGWPTTG